MWEPNSNITLRFGSMAAIEESAEALRTESFALNSKRLPRCWFFDKFAVPHAASSRQTICADDPLRIVADFMTRMSALIREQILGCSIRQSHRR